MSATPLISARKSDRAKKLTLGGAVMAALALAKVGGFHDLTLDLKAETITVAYEPAAGRLQGYVAAINDLVYEASLPAPRTASAR